MVLVPSSRATRLRPLRRTAWGMLRMPRKDIERTVDARPSKQDRRRESADACSNLQRQLWFLAASARAGQGGMLRVAERPVHPADLVGLAHDHELDGAARAVLAAQINALLELHPVLMRVEVPDVLVGKDQDDAVTVAQPRRPHARMEMESQRELVVRRAAWRHALVGRQKEILAVDLVAVGADPEVALMDKAEAARITVMSGAQRGARFRLALARDRDVVRARDDRRADQAAEHSGFEELRRRAVVERHGRMRGGCPRDPAPVVASSGR